VVVPAITWSAESWKICERKTHMDDAADDSTPLRCWVTNIGAYNHTQNPNNSQSA